MINVFQINKEINFKIAVVVIIDVVSGYLVETGTLVETLFLSIGA